MEVDVIRDQGDQWLFETVTLPPLSRADTAKALGPNFFDFRIDGEVWRSPVAAFLWAHYVEGSVCPENVLKYSQS